jgi:hypothetical protein
MTCISRRIWRITTALTSSLFGACALAAQSPPLNAADSLALVRIVRLSTLQPHFGTRARVSNGQFLFVPDRTRIARMDTIAMRDVALIDVQIGTESARATRFGLVSGVLAGFLAALTVKGSTESDVSPAATIGLITIPTLLGALAGRAIGRATPRWHRIYTASSSDLLPNPGPTW